MVHSSSIETGASPEWSVTWSFQFPADQYPPPFANGSPIAIVGSGSLIGSGCRVAFRLDEDGKIVSAELFNPVGIKASAMQHAPWARWLNLAQAQIRAQQLQAKDRNEGLLALVDSSDLTDQAMRNQRLRKVANRKRPGRARHDDNFYPEKAKDYTRFVTSGTPGEKSAPIEALAEKHKVSRHTAAGWVKKARELGYVPPANRKKPS